MRTVGFGFAVALTTGVVAPFAYASVAAASIQVVPGGSTVVVAGEHFEDNVDVKIRATIPNGSGEAKQRTNSDGKFKVAFALPEGFSGTVRVKAESQDEQATRSLKTAVPQSTLKSLDSSSAAAKGASVAPVFPSSTTTSAIVARSTALPTTTASLASDGSSMPVGNLPGWRQIFADDFKTPISKGSWPGPYASKWVSYDGFADTNNTGDYNNDIISVSNGVMNFALHSQNGRPQVAAPAPIIGSSAWKGQTYGRYSVRFRADKVDGYKTAWLLWPDSDQWTSEVDFPEGDLDGSMNAFNHCPGNTRNNCSAFDTASSYNAWHIATIEWTPQSVKFILDGRVVGQDANVSHEPMHWVLQTETAEDVSTSAAGSVQIDWVTAYARS